MVPIENRDPGDETDFNGDTWENEGGTISEDEVDGYAIEYEDDKYGDWRDNPGNYGE